MTGRISQLIFSPGGIPTTLNITDHQFLITFLIREMRECLEALSIISTISGLTQAPDKVTVAVVLDKFPLQHVLPKHLHLLALQLEFIQCCLSITDGEDP